jgi:hypothetical protein
MKAVMVNDSIISLENVRRVDRRQSHNKKEQHTITIHYTDDRHEVIFFPYDDLDFFNAIFEGIFNKLTEN